MKQNVSGASMFGYSLGDGGVSIVTNGINNFGMLFYTSILGLSPLSAGLALSLTTIWDAVSDPLMGHISDHTRSRFGRRIPYLLPGGLLMVIAFFSLWTVPQTMDSKTEIFWSILLLNLVFKTFLTVFIVPHTALGFEICVEYVDRSKLQGIRNFMNQITNLAFGAFAWMLFFKDGVSETGERIDGTAVMDNYLYMGVTLSVVAVAIIVLYVMFVRCYAEDTRALSNSQSENVLLSVFKSTTDIFKDKLAWYVFGLMAFGLLAMLMTSQVQMFTYVFYMEFNATEKSFVHGGGMLASALGGLFLLPILVAHFDKKGCAIVSIAMSSAGGILLALIFNGGVLSPGQEWILFGLSLPVSTIVFGLLQGLWWGGAGILVALAMSMIADISEIHNIKKGEAKDGSYSAALTFFQKSSISIGLFLTGGMVEWAGIHPQESSQSAEALQSISLLTFLSGPVLMTLAFIVILGYPVNKTYLEELRQKHLASKQTSI